MTRSHRAHSLVLAAALAAAWTLAGCSARERSNPLDPRNAATAGKPAGFTAVALSGQVLLSWNSTPGLSMLLHRRADGAPDFVAISPVLPPGTTLFADGFAPNDITYHYRLYFVAPSGIVGLPATADATPSRVIAWTADGQRGSLVRMSADGREIASEQPAFGEPGHLAVDRERKLVWVTDLQGGRVVIYQPSLGARVAITGFQSPNVVALDPADGSGWITDYSAGIARHFLPSGGPGTPSQIAPLDGPLGVDVDPQTRALWICERRAGKVRRFNVNGIPTGSLDIPSPSRVAVDSANGEAWVTSFETGKLFHIGTSMNVLHTVTGLIGPVGVAVDPRLGRIWVADPAAAQVLAYRRDGTRELQVTGLAGARDLAVELASGEAWVALSTSVVRISTTGVVLATTRGLSAPVAVGLDRFAP